MDRSELAKELREIATWLSKAEADGDLLAAAVCEIHPSPILMKAAAALEEEDQNARRYPILMEALSNEWPDSRSYRITSGQQGQPVLVTSRSNPDSRWHPTINAALDAWLEEHPNA